MRHSRRALLALAVMGAASFPASAQPPAGDAERLLAAWGERREAVATAKYSLKWQWFPTRIKPDDLKPGENGAFTGTGLVLFDFGNGRLRVDQDNLLHFTNRRERLSRARLSLRYDGQEMASYLAIDFDAAAAPPEPSPTSVRMGPWGQTGLVWPDEFNPLLWGHGRMGTPHDTAARTFPMAWVASAGRFTDLGREEVAGRDCVKLRDQETSAGATVTLWVDPGRGGAILRRRQLNKAGWVSDTDVTYREYPHGWFPTGWTVTDTRPGGQPVVGRRCKVEAATFNERLPLDDFRLTLKPGQTVSKAGSEYRVGDDGNLSPVQRPDSGSSHPSAGRLARVVLGAWWWAAAGLAVTLVLGVTFVRLRRHRSTSP